MIIVYSHQSKKSKELHLLLINLIKLLDLYSTAVSIIRQPIESFFNWVQQKTNIQIASKVGSEKGLFVYIYTKMAAAILILLGF